MQLIEQLSSISETDESIFRRQLAKEDLARLSKLKALFESCEDEDAFSKEGLYIGWTQNDMRTHELKDAITGVLICYHRILAGDNSAEAHETLSSAWEVFHRDRLEKLVHCL